MPSIQRFPLYGFFDSDWVSDANDRHSIAGFAILSWFFSYILDEKETVSCLQIVN